MTGQFDVIVIGMGPGGEVASSRLLSAGKRVAVIERELIGGECTYWACVPSKTLLRPPKATGEVDRVAGVDGARATGRRPGRPRTGGGRRWTTGAAPRRGSFRPWRTRPR